MSWGNGGRAHHVCPLHVLLKESSDLVLQEPGLLDVCHTVVKVRLKPFDQCLQVPLLQSEVLPSGTRKSLRGAGKGRRQRQMAAEDKGRLIRDLTVDRQGPQWTQRPRWVHSREADVLKLMGTCLNSLIFKRPHRQLIDCLWAPFRTTP